MDDDVERLPAVFHTTDGHPPPPTFGARRIPVSVAQTTRRCADSSRAAQPQRRLQRRLRRACQTMPPDDATRQTQRTAPASEPAPAHSASPRRAALRLAIAVAAPAAPPLVPRGFPGRALGFGGSGMAGFALFSDGDGELPVRASVVPTRPLVFFFFVKPHLHHHLRSHESGLCTLGHFCMCINSLYLPSNSENYKCAHSALVLRFFALRSNALLTARSRARNRG